MVTGRILARLLPVHFESCELVTLDGKERTIYYLSTNGDWKILFSKEALAKAEVKWKIRTVSNCKKTNKVTIFPFPV